MKSVMINPIRQRWRWCLLRRLYAEGNTWGARNYVRYWEDGMDEV